MEPFEKLERDGEIAVLYSPGYGAGWFTWNTEHPGLMFDRDIVAHVLKEDRARAISLAETKYPGIYPGGGEQLQVCWVPKGQRFTIDEYDGSESVRFLSPTDGYVA